VIDNREQAELEQAVQHLSSFERASASEGERRAAEWISHKLAGLGCHARVEQERAHGGYWWPLGLLNAAAAGVALAALRRPQSGTYRALAAAVGASAAAAVYDDVGGGRLWFRRALLPERSTYNVVAECGDLSAPHTVLLIAHHDAAHSGLIFHPALPRIGPRLFPKLHARSTQSVPIIYGVWLGPLLTAASALFNRRRPLAGAAIIALGAAAMMIDVGRAVVVPGANDNLSAVAVLLALARSLRDRPAAGVRVMLISTGSEESFMEGMHGFARRHFSALDPKSTEVLCLECVGGPILTMLEGEGMLRMRDYTSQTREALKEAADTAGVELARNLRTVAATDALIALRRGYPTVTLASVDFTGFPANYHWPSDTPENLRWDTIRDAIAVSEQFVRRQR
jgi:hypothetical protein